MVHVSVRERSRQVSIYALRALEYGAPFVSKIVCHVDVSLGSHDVFGIDVYIPRRRFHNTCRRSQFTATFTLGNHNVLGVDVYILRRRFWRRCSHNVRRYNNV